jgi:hypothetical protein
VKNETFYTVRDDYSLFGRANPAFAFLRIDILIDEY